MLRRRRPGGGGDDPTSRPDSSVSAAIAKMDGGCIDPQSAARLRQVQR
jgi:hypothetical protein